MAIQGQLPRALAWKYGNGHGFRLKNTEAGWTIEEWPTDPAPTEAELAQVLTEYETAIASVAYLALRRDDYVSRTLGEKGGADAIDALGFWMDETVEQIDAIVDALNTAGIAVPKTAGFQAILDIRTAVKAAHPKAGG